MILCIMYVYVLEFLSNPRESHLKVIKRILCYLVGYCDADFVGDRVEWKRTSGGCHYIGPCLISWARKKHNSIPLSTTKDEYVFATSCCSQLLWVKYQLEDYYSFENNIQKYCDNISAINLSKNLIQHSKAKNIEIRYHFIHDYMKKVFLIQSL